MNIDIESNRRKVYNYLNKKGIKGLPSTFDAFNESIDKDEHNRQLYYDVALQQGAIKNGNRKDFDTMLGLGQVQEQQNQATMLNALGDAMGGTTGATNNDKEVVPTIKPTEVDEQLIKSNDYTFDKSDWAVTPEQKKMYETYTDLHKKYSAGMPTEETYPMPTIDETSANIPLLKQQYDAEVDKRNKILEEAQKEYKSYQDIKEAIPSYMKDEEETIEDVQNNLMDFWTNNTKEGQEALQQYGDKVRELQREFENSTDFLNADEETNNEAFYNKYGDQIEELNNTLYNSAIKANPNYYAMYSNKVGRKAADRTQVKLENSIDEQIKGKEKAMRDSGKEYVYNRLGQVVYDIDTQELIDAKKFAEDSRTLMNAASNGAGFKEGMWDGLSNSDTWDMGLGELMRNSKLKAVIDKQEKGQELTKEEETLLDAATNYMAVSAYYSNSLGRGYKAGLTTSMSIPFMLEFMATPLEGISNGIVKGLMRHGFKKYGIRGTGMKWLRAGSQALVGYPAAAAMQTVTWSTPKVIAGAIDREMGDIDYTFSEDGKTIEYGGIQEDSKQNAAKALYNSFLDQTIENYSELAFSALKPISRLMRKSDIIRAVSNSAPVTRYTEFWKRPIMRELHDRVKFRGLVGEFAEEELGSALRLLLTPDDMQDYVLDDNGERVKDENGNYVTRRSGARAGFNVDDQIDTILGLLPMSVFFGGVGLTQLAYNKAKTSLNARRFEKALTDDNQKRLFHLAMSESNSGKFYEQAHDAIRNIINNRKLTTDAKVSGINALVGRYAEDVSNELDAIQRNVSDNLFNTTTDHVLSQIQYDTNDEKTENKVIAVRDGQGHTGFVVKGHIALGRTLAHGNQTINRGKSDRNLEVVYAKGDGTFTKPLPTPTNVLHDMVYTMPVSEWKAVQQAKHVADIIGSDTYERNGRVFDRKTDAYIGTKEEVSAYQSIKAKVDYDKEQEKVVQAVEGEHKEPTTHNVSVTKPQKATAVLNEKTGDKMKFTYAATELALNEDGTVNLDKTKGLIITDKDGKPITKKHKDYQKYIDGISKIYQEEAAKRKLELENKQAKVEKEAAEKTDALKKQIEDIKQQQSAEQQFNALVDETLKTAKYDEDGVLDKKSTDEQRVADTIRKKGREEAIRKSQEQLVYLHQQLEAAQKDTKKSPDERDAEIERMQNRIAKREAAIVKFFGQETLDQMNQPAAPAAETPVAEAPVQEPQQPTQEPAPVEQPEEEVQPEQAPVEEPVASAEEEQAPEQPAEPELPQEPAQEEAAEPINLTDEDIVLVSNSRSDDFVFARREEKDGHVTYTNVMTGKPVAVAENVAYKKRGERSVLTKHIVYRNENGEYVPYVALTVSPSIAEKQNVNIIRADGTGEKITVSPKELLEKKGDTYSPIKKVMNITEVKANKMTSVDELLDTVVFHATPTKSYTLRELLSVSLEAQSRTRKVNEKGKEIDKKENISPFTVLRAESKGEDDFLQRGVIFSEDLKKIVEIWNKFFAREDVKKVLTPIFENAMERSITPIMWRYRQMNDSANRDAEHAMEIRGSDFTHVNWNNPIYQMMIMLNTLKSLGDVEVNGVKLLQSNIKDNCPIGNKKVKYALQSNNIDNDVTTSIVGKKLSEVVQMYYDSVENDSDDQYKLFDILKENFYHLLNYKDKTLSDWRNELALYERTPNEVDGTGIRHEEIANIINQIIDDINYEKLNYKNNWKRYGNIKPREGEDIDTSADDGYNAPEDNPDDIEAQIARDEKIVNRAAGEFVVSVLSRAGVRVHIANRAQLDEVLQRKVGKDYTAFRDNGGILYGWAVNGEFYINPDMMNANTPIHEYTHLWFAALEKANPKEAQRIIRTLKRDAKFMWDIVANDKSYTDIHGDDARMASEVLARLTGSYFGREENGKSVLQNMLESKDMQERLQAQSILGALRRFWNWILNQFGYGFHEYKTAEFDAELQSIINAPIYSIIEQQEMSRENGGEEFQIIGESGAQRIDEQLGMDTMSNLDIAQRMVSQGKTSEQIKYATGWEQDDTGKWKYEIMDGKVNTDVKPIEGDEFNEYGNFDQRSVLLSDLYKNDALYEAYPRLKQMVVAFNPSREMKGEGAFNVTNNDNTAGGYIALDVRYIHNNDAESLKELLIHELQHAIQYYEHELVMYDNEEYDKRYDELPNEAEAYDAQTRSNLNEDERRVSLSIGYAGKKTNRTDADTPYYIDDYALSKDEYDARQQFAQPEFQIENNAENNAENRAENLVNSENNSNFESKDNNYDERGIQESVQGGSLQGLETSGRNDESGVGGFRERSGEIGELSNQEQLPTDGISSDGRRLLGVRVKSVNDLVDRLLIYNGISAMRDDVVLADSKTFHDAIAKNKAHNSMGWCVDVHDIEEYDNMTCLLSEDGKCGIAITQDGDIVSLFSVPNKGALNKLIPMAIALGGRKGDFYMTPQRTNGLQNMCARFGGVVTGMTPFNADFMSENKQWVAYKEELKKENMEKGMSEQEATKQAELESSNHPCGACYFPETVEEAIAFKKNHPNYEVDTNTLPVFIDEEVDGETIYGYDKMIDDRNAHIENLKSIAEERARIESEAKANGTWMKAPNGLPSKLNERQWVDVRLQSFKDWFGDWENDPENASKVIDKETGEPLVVYHGSPSSGFDVFEPYHNLTGIYTTNNAYASNVYAQKGKEVKDYNSLEKEAELGASKHHGIYPLFVNMRNPMIVDFSDENGNPRMWNEYGESRYDVILEYYEEHNIAAPSFATYEEAVQFAKENGEDHNAVVESHKTTDDFVNEAEASGEYDGCIFLNVMDGTENLPKYLRGMDDYVALAPYQVKSATQNNGEYSEKDDRIEFQIEKELGDPSDIDATVIAYEQNISDRESAKAYDVHAKEPERLNLLHRVINSSLDRTEGIRLLQDKINAFRRARGLKGIDGQHDVRALMDNMGGTIQFKFEEYKRNERKNLEDAVKVMIDLVKNSEMYKKYQVEKWKSENEEELHELTETEFIERYLMAMDSLERIEIGKPPRGIKEFRLRMGTSMSKFADEFYETFDKDAIKNLCNAVKACTNVSIKADLAGGLISQEEYDEYNRRKYYVPERDFAEIENTPEENFIIGGNQKRGKRRDKDIATMYRAEGGESLAANVFANIDLQAFDALDKSERNKVKIRMYELLMDNKEWCDVEGWKLPQKVWYRLNADGKYEPTYQEPTEEEQQQKKEVYKKIKEIEDLITMLNRTIITTEDADVIEDLEEQKEELRNRIRELKQQSPYLDSKEIRDVHRESEQEKDEKVNLFINGEPVEMDFVNQVQIANALNDVYFMNGSIGVVKRITNAISAACTTYNPAFFAVNVVRDVPFIVGKGTTEYGFDFAPRFVLNMNKPKETIGVIFKYLNGNLDTNTEAGQLLYNFMNGGGATGYAFLPEMNKLKKNVSDWNKCNTKISAEKFLDYCKMPTEFSELWTRFAAYKTVLEMGYSEMEALKAAKNLSVNFNRRGYGHSVLNFCNSLSMFANAAIQGATGFYRTFGGEGTTEKKVHRAIRAFMTMANIPMIAGFIATLCSPDDDDDEYKPSSWERDNYAIIGNFKCALNEQLKPFWVIGVNIAMGMQGRRTAAEIADSIITSLIRGILPIPPSISNPLVESSNSLFGVKDFSLSEIMRDMITPQAMQSLSDLAENKNFTGNKLRSDSGDTPEYLMGENEAIFYRDVARIAYKWTGGNIEAPSKMKLKDGKPVPVGADWNPKQIKAWTSILPSTLRDAWHFLYGTGRALSKDVDWWGDAVSIKDIPIANRFWIDEERQQRLFRIGVSREARHLLKEYREYENHMDKYLNGGNAAAIEGYIETQNKPSIYTLENLLDTYDKVSVYSMAHKYGMTTGQMKNYDLWKDLPYETLEEAERQLTHQVLDFLYEYEGKQVINDFPKWMEGKLPPKAESFIRDRSDKVVDLPSAE